DAKARRDDVEDAVVLRAVDDARVEIAARVVVPRDGGAAGVQEEEVGIEGGALEVNLVGLSFLELEAVDLAGLGAKVLDLRLVVLIELARDGDPVLADGARLGFALEDDGRVFAHLERELADPVVERRDNDLVIAVLGGSMDDTRIEIAAGIIV